MKKLNVPTWNYIAVHVYGKVKIIENEAKKMQILADFVAYFDKNYTEQYANLPNDYKINLAKRIVAIEIKIEKIQGNKKLSQNKTEKEKRNIIDFFENNQNSSKKIMAEYMKKNQTNKCPIH